MPLDNEPFVRMHDKKQKDTFNVHLNEKERADLEEMKKVLNQSKDSTAFKQLASIGTKVLHDKLTGGIVKTIFENKRKNNRLGIVDFEDQ